MSRADRFIVMLVFLVALCCGCASFRPINTPGHQNKDHTLEVVRPTPLEGKKQVIWYRLLVDIGSCPKDTVFAIVYDGYFPMSAFLARECGH